MHWVLNFKNGKSPARVNHASASVGNCIYSFGGYCEQLSFYELKHSTPIDVYQLNTITLKWKKRPIPDKESEQYPLTPYFRYGHTCVNYYDFVYLWGGRADWTNNLCNNLYKYDTKKHIWKIIEPVSEKPDGRDGHSACVIKNSMFIYGGFVQKVKKFSNDVYEFDFVQMTWTLITPKNNVRPYWRDFHTASAIGDNMYIFGGRMDLGGTRFTGENFYLNDLYSFNTKKKEWTQIIPDKSYLTVNTNNINNHANNNTNNNSNNANGSNENSSNNANEQQMKLSPCGRRSHSAVVYNDKMIIFGGFQENIHKHFNDMYIFDPDRNEWKVLNTKGAVPSQRRRHCCVIVNDQMFIFGGTGPTPNESPNSSIISSNQSPSVQDGASNEAAYTQHQNNVDVSYQEFMRRLENNLIYIQNATRERNNINFAELNNQFFAARLGLAAIGQQLAQIQPQLPPPPAQQPQNEFDNVQRVPVQNNNSNNTSNNNNNNNNNTNQMQNNILVIDEINDDSDFDDSDSEDLINDESDDEDRINTGLYSLSDLHILSLNVPSLKLLAKLKVLNENINYSYLPNDLIRELTELDEWRIASK